jgi:predicted ArsR family transcriptional regulator
MPYTFDEHALLKLVRESDGFKQLQEDANERVRALVREVNETHAGKPVAEVDAELRRKFEESGVTPEEPGFTETVTAIARGELTG